MSFHLMFLLLIIKLSENYPVQNHFFKLPVIHMNDFHARYEEINLDSGVCKTNKNNCIGGFSRLYSTITNLIKSSPNSILLNAGDNFEGTPWYSVHKWNVTQFFWNKLPIDALTLGNHEFEDGIEGLVPFLQNLKTKVVVANLDTSKELSLKNLIKKSVVVERKGLKIGIIGVILSNIKELGHDTGNLVFEEESGSVNREAERLVKEEGVFTNIVLSHCGYEVEKELARKALGKISLIVGGHSHSFLYTGEPVPGPDIPVGPYPTIITNKHNETVLVVQASSNSKYLGNITLFFDNLGSLVDWAGAPIFLNHNLPQDDQINQELGPWKKIIVDQDGDRVLGRTLVRLEQSSCPMTECLMGNFLTDAMVFAHTNNCEAGAWTNASIALMHAGGIRSGIDIGDITYNDIAQAQPFHNSIDVAEIAGRHLKDIFEAAVENSTMNLLQVSGVRVSYNLSHPQGFRVSSLRIRCRVCLVPIYEDLDEDGIYRIVLPSFLADGGFGFGLFSKYLSNRTLGNLDVELFSEYIKNGSPIFEEIQGRILINV